MKVVIINKSDSIGGAAVVSRRLTETLRALGVEANMLVVDKRTDSAHVALAAKPWRARIPFLAERLKIFCSNGFDRKNLFKVDTASDGLPLWRHPLVSEADVICLNWVNQGMLSLKGLRKLLQLGKPVVWTMHDMWNMTGICHHAGECRGWELKCGNCPLLGSRADVMDLSYKVWKQKRAILDDFPGSVHYVAVSRWLAGKARKSSNMSLPDKAPLSVIPNAFPIPADAAALRREARAARTDRKFRIVMGAARLDDPVKGLPILVKAMSRLRQRAAERADNFELVTFGTLRDPAALDGLEIAHRHLGQIAGEANVRSIYLEADAVVSTSLYETLPGTLVEGMVYGCIPVSFDRGGQGDIVDHRSTGYLAEWHDDPDIAADRICDGLLWAERHNDDQTRARMLEEATRRFAAENVARRYIELFRSLKTKN